LSQRRARSGPAGGPKPPASARPANGGRFAPAGPGAGLCPSRTYRSTWHRPARAGETRCVSRSRPDRRKHLHHFNGRGHRPCHSAAPGSGPAGGPKPPASARPAHGGRFSPAGSGAGLCISRTCRSTGHRPTRAGETRCVSCSRPDGRRHLHLPARTDYSTFTAAMAGAIAPATAPRRDQDQPGAKAPGQRPPRPWRALRTRRVGRWPFVVPGPTGLQGTVPRGRGKRGSRFLIPPPGAIPVPGAGRFPGRQAVKLLFQQPATRRIAGVGQRSVATARQGLPPPQAPSAGSRPRHLLQPR